MTENGTTIVSLEDRRRLQRRADEPEQVVRVVDLGGTYAIEIGPVAWPVRLPGEWVDAQQVLRYARQVAAAIGHIVATSPSVPEPTLPGAA